MTRSPFHPIVRSAAVLAAFCLAPGAHAETLRSQPLSAAEQAAFAASVSESLQQQQAMEAEPQGDFDAFVAAYQASILQM